MRTLRYLGFVPLLVFAAACQPQQPEPESTVAPPPQADSRMKSRDAARQPMEKPAPQRIGEVKIAATEGNSAGGTVRFVPEDDSVRVEGTITGLTPGAHGLHIHANGDCSSPDASSAGDHFSPNDNPHGSPQSPPDQHHAGDLGNVTAGADGTARISADDADIGLSGPDSIIGKALIVHAGRDDLKSQPSGNSGARVGCGVIREAAQTSAAGGGQDASEPTTGGPTG